MWPSGDALYYWWTDAHGGQALTGVMRSDDGGATWKQSYSNDPNQPNAGNIFGADLSRIRPEYTDKGNPWVPYPLSFHTWATLAAEAGFGETERLASVPSRFLGSIYSARSIR